MSVIVLDKDQRFGMLSKDQLESVIGSPSDYPQLARGVNHFQEEPNRSFKATLLPSGQMKALKVPPLDFSKLKTTVYDFPLVQRRFERTPRQDTSHVCQAPPGSSAFAHTRERLNGTSLNQPGPPIPPPGASRDPFCRGARFNPHEAYCLLDELVVT